MATWESSFDFYEATMDGDRAIVTLDLSAAPHAPVASHPVRLQIRVKMLHPRDDGLRAKEEADALFALEDKLVAAMVKVAEVIYVGRVVAQGYTEFFFYVPTARREAIDNPSHAVGDVAPYAIEWFSEDDIAWEKYEELFPNAYAFQSIMNRRLMLQMEQAGDQLHIPREVDHVADFPSEEKAQSAATALAAAGFRVDPLEKPEPGGETWQLQFHRDDACDGGKPDAFVFEILDLITPLEGEYDGWGSLVQKQ